LFQDTVLRAWRKIVVGLTGNGDYAFFLIVSILPVAAACSIEVPAILLDELYDSVHLHGWDAGNSIYFRQRAA
jgi:hypothetical protein